MSRNATKSHRMPKMAISSGPPLSALIRNWSSDKRGLSSDLAEPWNQVRIAFLSDFQARPMLVLEKKTVRYIKHREQQNRALPVDLPLAPEANSKTDPHLFVRRVLYSICTHLCFILNIRYTQVAVTSKKVSKQRFQQRYHWRWHTVFYSYF